MIRTNPASRAHWLINQLSHSAILAVLFIFLASMVTVARANDTRPNIVFILADDLRSDEIRQLTRLNSFLVDRGTSFRQYFTPNALCCPSRASTLRGQFSHNTEIWTNFGGSGGGFEGFYRRGLESETIAVWLQRSGYDTMLLGKYLNEYGKPLGKFSTLTYVPPGWNRWFALVDERSSSEVHSIYSGYNYPINDNGVLRRFGNAPTDYSTDVLARKAQEYIIRSGEAAPRKPFFLYLAPTAPHRGLSPAPRHQPNTFADYTPDLGPAFNEADVSDKPDWIRAIPPLSRSRTARIVDDARRRLGTMLAVEDMLSGILDALQQTGQADNTFIFFASDNGYHFGEHRLPSKATIYDAAVRVPLIVYGPGVPAGQMLDHLVYNHDLPATFAAIAGAATPGFLDGKSIVPLLTDTPPPVRPWRNAVLLEHREHRSGGLTQPDVNSIRTAEYQYVEYVNNTQRCELYVISPDADPNALENRCGDPNLATAQAELASRLRSLQSCSGASCRELEQAPLSADTRNAARRR